MNRKTCKTLILGATFYGISKLMNNPEDCILIERTFTIGGEFSFNERGAKAVAVKSDFGKKFKDELYTAGYLDDEGNIYTALALFLYCEHLSKISYDILFFTEVTHIEKSGDKYHISIFNSDGFSVITADEIIDTTSCGVLHDCIDEVECQKSLNLIVDFLHNADTADKQSFALNYKEGAADKPQNTIIYNPLADIYVYKFPLELRDDYITARKKLHDYWHYADLRILLTASAFAYDMPYTKAEISEGHYWIPSCGFDNLLSAIDEGQVSGL